MTNQEIQELVALTGKGKGIPSEVWANMTPKEYSLYRFFQSRDTNWADKLGGVVPHYPSQRHIEKNLAPEQNTSRMGLEVLAQANQIARKNKLMSPQLADKMLPTTLVESAIGINGWGYPDTPKYRDILTKAGLPPTREGILSLVGNTTYDRELVQAKLMHALMAAKAAQYGDDLALERWNGKGTNARRGADASNHYRKVLETSEMLQHPKNKELMDTWNALSQRYAGEAPQEMRETPDENLNWEDENLPAFLGTPLSALRNALPNKPIEKLQRAVRDWTAPTMVPKETVNKAKGGTIDKPLPGGHKII
jgi:hypothetical protein